MTVAKRLEPDRPFRRSGSSLSSDDTMPLLPSRRRFLFGAAAVLAAPAIVRVAQVMSISVPKPLTFGGVPFEFDDHRPQHILVGNDFLEAYQEELLHSLTELPGIDRRPSRWWQNRRV